MIAVNNKGCTQDAVSRFKPIKLLPHQKKLLQHVTDDTFPLYICFGMGSGKTIASLMCMTLLPNASKVLVICDKSTRNQWKTEAEKVLCRNASEFKELVVHIVHYEYLQQDDAPEPRAYQMTIVDEAHRFRNAWEKESKRMLHWMYMIQACPRVIYLSGTPFIHDAHVEREAFDKMMGTAPLVNRVFFYDPREDPKSANKYPDTIERQVDCEMSWSQCFVYLQNRRQRFQLHLQGEDAPRSRISASNNTYNSMLRLLSNNPFPDNPALSPKFQRILQQMEDHCTCKQIVYSSRRDTGVVALQLLWDKRAAGKSFRITGDMSSDDRSRHIQTFNRSPHSVLFITDAGAQGIDLKRVDVVHLMEPSENIQDERQITNRAVRYKSHNDSNATVTILRYVSVFPVSGLVAPPWKNVLYASGLFEKTEMKGITRKVQYAMKALICDEESNETIDQRTLRVRAERQVAIDKAMLQLKLEAQTQTS